MAKTTKTTKTKANPNPVLSNRTSGTLSINVKKAAKTGYVASFFSFVTGKKAVVKASGAVRIKQAVKTSKKGKSYVAGAAWFKTKADAEKAKIVLS
jgi:hypothetical protein